MAVESGFVYDLLVLGENLRLRGRVGGGSWDFLRANFSNHGGLGFGDLGDVDFFFFSSIIEMPILAMGEVLLELKTRKSHFCYILVYY